MCNDALRSLIRIQLSETVGKEHDHIRLQPANPDMKPILIHPEDGEVRIVGKVIGVYRRM
jgi:SOS-response transcriptional repressor LexA